jgi:hypothetical protein
MREKRGKEKERKTKAEQKKGGKKERVNMKIYREERKWKTRRKRKKARTGGR